LTHVAGGARLVKDVGEFSLIGGVTNLIESSRVESSGLELGAGDDAALWRPRPGRLAVISTDMLVESIHFRHPWSDAASVGHRALAVNLSDLAAMGARPRLALCALGLRGDESDRWVYDFYRGAMALAQTWQTRIAGGDIVRIPADAGTTIAVTVLGDVRPARVMRRDAAQPGDILAVTGPLGLAAGGVRALQADQTKLDGAPVLLAAHRRPEPRILHGLLLARAGVRAAMDLSDGLLGDLPKLCAASHVSAQLEFDQLPIPNALRWNFRSDYKDLVLRGGEDFELLFSAPPDVFLRAVELCLRSRLPIPIPIGNLSAPSGERPTITMRWTDRRREEIPPGAFDHFAQPVAAG
jgi:thiamine-monophosphate kinase